ncbi:TlpA disulfide reductase family protein [Nocardioides sp. TF02-7]|uniref:TlpA family protein disulfide reductase n=1 Tax=Nocardioides sp. TF02-7 TaxID=2917724 RepID=UPI001F055AE2|nr:TlpA disulfide reductase family protein [Nocardioides sp. TF02-7]UMG92249.1 TlpA family protein disulfide reductase [Nocardioides sp. TF02-7]
MSVLVLVAGCAAPSGVPSSERATIHVEPVAVPGIEGCGRLAQGTPPSSDSEERLPEVSLPCLTEDRSVDLTRLGDGRPMVVNLWASWCGPCREEMPRLAEASRETKSVGFVGINTQDDPEFAASFLAGGDVRYPQLVDVDGAVLDSTRVPGLPVTLGVDADGAVVGRIVGEASAEELADLIASVGG